MSQKVIKDQGKVCEYIMVDYKNLRCELESKRNFLILQEFYLENYL